MERASNVSWTREQRLIALNLYCKLPFGKLHKGNPIIKEVAAKMGRTASSLTLKLCNFASLDPVLQARGIAGMKGASRLDKVEWEEFTSNIATLGPLSEQLLHDLLTTNADEEADLLQYDKIILAPVRALTPPTGPTTATALVNVRRGQQFFRQSILSAYGLRCCISGINAPGLLVASHIKPWQEFPDERLNPRNGLCLSSLHDAALDKGLIALDEGMRVVLSDRLRSYMPQRALEENFVPYEGVAIRLPDRLAEPSTEFIRYHREFVFQA